MQPHTQTERIELQDGSLAATQGSVFSLSSDSGVGFSAANSFFEILETLFSAEDDDALVGMVSIQEEDENSQGSED